MATKPATKQMKTVRIPVWIFREFGCHEGKRAIADYFVTFSKAAARKTNTSDNEWDIVGDCDYVDVREEEMHRRGLRLPPGAGPVKAELVVTLPAKTKKKGK